MAPHLPSTMSGVLVEKTGGTEVLQYKTDLPLPIPKEGEVLVKNDVIGINFIDVYFRTGLYPSTKPEILGKEAAGHIVAVGPNVNGFAEQDRVVWMATGSYAAYSAVPAAKTIKIPERISSPDACAAILQGLTALTLTEESHKVKKDDWVLVTAASGGVGGWLCQILKAKGAHTIATVGSQPKVKVAKDHGADVVLVEGEVDVRAEIMNKTNGAGVIAIFDGVGKSTFDRNLEVIARKGTIVSFGNASGAVEPFAISRLSAKNAKVLRPTLFNYIYTREEFDQYANELFQMMIEDKFQTNIFKTYDLKDVAQAQDDLEGRRTTGKLLMKPKP